MLQTQRFPRLKNKKGVITSPELKARHVRRAIEQQQGDQRVHSGTLNIVGEFGIGEIANRFVAGVDVMRNVRDLGPIYNQGIMIPTLILIIQTTPILLRRRKTAMAMPTNITI